MSSALERTEIYRQRSNGEELVGYLAADGVIYQLCWDAARAVGRIDEHGHLFRQMSHDERELGLVTPSGRVRSHGLFQGGELGWVDPDGTVVQAGLILGEEEVGRVAGPQPTGAAAALLLLFLPDEFEADKAAGLR